MSRAGKHPVKLTQGVTAAIADGVLTVKGPKGEIKLPLDTKHAGLVDVVVESDQVVVTPKDAEDKTSRAMWGTMTRNVRAAVIGVTDGFSKEMYMNGVGYKASVSGNKLVLGAGYSHDVVMEIPDGLTVKMGDKPTEFIISGSDKCLVGQFADKVHKVRKPDPYKGKGIFYKGERIRRKEGKKK